jgi:tRNA nucleotidyltransferase (CCA-adding enzyme)
VRIKLPSDLERILGQTAGLEEACLVGGSVRDALFGWEPKDFDIEVYGTSYEALRKALTPSGRLDVVGRSFGVIKLTTPEGNCYDFSLPRRDSKTGRGHTGFQVEVDPGINPKEAASRRDFTINALAWHPRSGEVRDYFGGLTDIHDRVLRHVGPAFVEDPLRVLRGMQFAGRFDLVAAPETLDLCRSIQGTYPELAGERVREEWFKWAAKSVRPSAGLRFLQATGWLEHFPELHALQGVPQEPDWHPEGDVFVHTCHCCDALAALPEWQASDVNSRIVYMLAVLTHDFGKAVTTRTKIMNGRTRIVSPGHESEGRPIAEAFLQRIHATEKIIARVLPLVTNHMAHLQTLNERSVRRLAKRLAPETIQGLGVVITADSFGRPPKPRELPEGLVELRRIAAQLELQSTVPAPLLQGRHLIGAGLTPGKEFGPLLEEAFEAQLDGAFRTEAGAIAWMEDRLKRRP